MKNKFKRYIQKCSRLYIFKKAINILRWIDSKAYYFFIVCIYNYKINIDNCENMLIIAHPDDEMIFFDKYLINNKNTFVLCLTNGGNRIRSKEFFLSMQQYSTTGVMFNYRDSIYSEWNEKKVNKDIFKYYINRKWIDILTHNENGEYGHLHHIVTNKLVNKICSNNKIMVPLLTNLKFSLDGLLNENQIKEKEERFKKIYKSQYEGILNKDDKYYRYFIHESIGIENI